MSVRVLIALTVLALLAPAAHADSIAYVRDGDVWLAAPDGSRQQRVTTTGGYSYVSQADDGVMIALAPKERLHRLSRTGKVLADFSTMVSDGEVRGPVTKFHGPFTPEISPDGSRVAFEWFNDSYENEPGCSETSSPPCYVYSQRQGVAISHGDRHTGPEEFGLLTGWIFPHWMSGDVLLRSFSGATANDDAVFTKVGPGKGDDELDPWFYDDTGYGVDDVELSRDLTTAAGIAGFSGEELRVYRTLTHPYGAPDWNHQPFAEGNQPVVERCFSIPGEPGKLASPTLSPDARGLAWSDGQGIHVLALPGFASGCAQPAAAARLVIPGGRHPDWGPAGIPPESEYRTGGGGDGGEQRQDVDEPSAFAVRVKQKRLRRSVAVAVAVPAAGRVRVELRRGGRRVAAREASLTGDATVRVRVPRRLRRLPRLRLTVRATYRPAAGGPEQRAVTRVRLRR